MVVYDLNIIDNTHYVWELAISIYDDSFDESNSTNNTVTLSENKEMGIAIAYCDNDGGTQRENFIGLVDVAAEHFNSAWQDADVFGKLMLNGPTTDLEENSRNSASENIRVFQDKQLGLVIENHGKSYGNTTVSILDLNGRLIKESSVYLEERVTLNIHSIMLGAYIVNLKSENFNSSIMFYKY